MTSQLKNFNFEQGKAAGEREEYAQALEFFEEAVNEGFIPALTYLASMFEHGLGVEVDPQKSLELLFKAADLSDAEACNRLGYLHAVGKFLPKNLGAAVEYHKIAAKQGLANSQCDLGRHYAHGLGVQQNLAEAQRWYELAAEAGHNLAQHSLAGILLNFHNPHRDTARGMKWLEAAAAGGNVKAQYEVGSLKLGATFPELQDYKGAAHWLDLAANNGSLEAIYQIGNCFEHGVGVDQNYEAAAFNYFEACKNGNIEAAFALGTLFENGLGVDQDYKSALKFYGMAAEHFHASALFNLGRLHQFGWGVPADYEKAHLHFLAAAERGHVMCQFLVGRALLWGTEGTKPDIKEGISWMRRAAEAGLSEAQAKLGFCYLAGQGVEHDHDEALRWSLAAAEQGHAWAQYRAAHILIRYEPRGEHELTEAVKWLVRSFNQPQQEGESRHEFIKDDFSFLQSVLPDDVFKTACREATMPECQGARTLLGGKA